MTAFAAAVAPLAAALVSALAVAALLRRTHALPQDLPGDRSLHTRPMPRAGGYALWAGVLAAAAFAPLPIPGGVATWLPAFAAVALVSARDDRGGVPVLARLAVQVAAALWCAQALVGAGALPGSPATFAAVALALVWSANLYNFMDGSDGLALAMAIVGFAAMGAAALANDLPAAGLLAVAAAALPVLAVNRPPARMFIGDVGSVPLGFMAGLCGIGGVIVGGWGWWFPLLVFLPFVLDASLTLARRVVRGERFWKPHRSHYYQRLHRLGAGHRGTLAAYGAAMLGVAATAVACAARAPGWGPPALAAWSVVLFMLFATIEYHWNKVPNRT